MQACDLILLGLYPSALCAAIASDLAVRKIPNLVITAILAGFVALWFLMPLPDLSLRLLVAAAVTGLGFSLFAENLIGAGDAKLAGVLMLWLDPLQVPLFIAASGIIGAFLTLAARVERNGAGAGLIAHAHTLPYGVALAGAGLILLPFSSLLHGG